ncbi:unnamed protein product [Schistosoma curassoni]|uniref:CCHC-type domain-containing protein n=4 Tax=Schistosoma TaxID=6181 RepID=A0A183KJ62_9TREM|nr:unnamed protein product [Schistosoma curassoni]
MRRRCYRCRDPNHLIAQCPLLHSLTPHCYLVPGPSTSQVPPRFSEARLRVPQLTLTTAQQQLPQQTQQPFMQYFFPPGFGDDDDDEHDDFRE